MKQKLLIVFLMNHNPSEAQTSDESKLQILKEMDMTYQDTTLEQMREEFQVEFISVKPAPSVEYLKNIPPNATTSEIRSAVYRVVEQVRSLCEQDADRKVAFWYEGVTIVSCLFDRAFDHWNGIKSMPTPPNMLKAHSERVSVELPNGEKKSSFIHKKFLVY